MATSFLPICLASLNPSEKRMTSAISSLPGLDTATGQNSCLRLSGSFWRPPSLPPSLPFLSLPFPSLPLSLPPSPFSPSPFPPSLPPSLSPLSLPPLSLPPSLPPSLPFLSLPFPSLPPSLFSLTCRPSSKWLLWLVCGSSCLSPPLPSPLLTSSQLNTRTCLPNCPSSAFTDSVLPVPAGP